MQSPFRTIIRIGGVLNLLFAVFHLYLCYNIYELFSAQPFYPLLQMFAVGGVLMIWFLTYTSLAYAQELASSRVGAAVIVLNVLIYGSRVVGEIVLFPHPKPVIIVLCSLMAALYGYALIARKTAVRESTPGVK